mmetsp:Transcript_3/g.9  ORF Transcript_3/g.9 Transcript_3/m.9 type:complete len:152 (-) Transcript_3:2-457(-)
MSGSGSFGQHVSRAGAGSSWLETPVLTVTGCFGRAKRGRGGGNSLTLEGSFALSTFGAEEVSGVEVELDEELDDVVVEVVVVVEAEDIALCVSSPLEAGSSSSLGSSEVEWLLAVLFALLPADAKANFKPPMPPFVGGSGLAARLSGNEQF